MHVLKDDRTKPNGALATPEENVPLTRFEHVLVYPQRLQKNRRQVCSQNYSGGFGGGVGGGGGAGAVAVVVVVFVLLVLVVFDGVVVLAVVSDTR